jgi:hypothetical protein
LIYKPVAGEPPDYLICYQCGFMLRQFSNPPDRRFDLASVPAAYDEVRRLLLAPDGIARTLGLSDAQVTPFGAQLLDGLLIHLHSVPRGLRVATWLVESYPEFRDLQKIQVMRELAQAKGTLNPQIRSMTPARIYTSTQCISAALAGFWAAALGKPDIKAPYRLHYEKCANELLTIWHELPDDPGHDIELVDRWADKLGLASWYQWVPYEPPM